MSQLVSPEQYKIAVALLLCSPCLPLLFMGEEFSETNPFLYFTSHGDPELSRLVSEGRRKEFEDFGFTGAFADPQAPEAFERSKLNWRLLDEPGHNAICHFYRALIRWRKLRPCLNNGRKDLTRVEIDESAKCLRMERADPSGSRALLICNFANNNSPTNLDVGTWQFALSTTPQAADPHHVPPCSASLYLANP